MNVLPKLNKIPTRIISLVPSQTELLFDLGLREEVVGITKFCVHPNNWLKEKKIVGGTKNFHLDRIHALQPDLIIANHEENTKEQIEALQSHYPVYISDIQHIDDAFQMIIDIGGLVNRSSESFRLIDEIKLSRKQISNTYGPYKTLYFIWYNPWMAAGTDTFIHSMMLEAGMQNCLQLSRYPILNYNDIQQLNPELILLSSEPFPFKQGANIRD